MNTFLKIAVLHVLVSYLPVCGGSGSSDSSDTSLQDVADAFVPDIPASEDQDSCDVADILQEMLPQDAPDTENEAGAVDPVVYWSQETTKTIDDLVFVKHDGQNFFAIGFDTHSGPVYDGVTGSGQCDEEKGIGLLDIQVEKNKKASESGANFVYVWSYGKYKDTIVAATPQFAGIFHTGWTYTIPAEKDVIPVIFNAFGESDMGGYKPEKIAEMKQKFADFKARTGDYSKEKLPSLPPYEELPWFAWHPTWRMIGNEDGAGEMLSHEEATEYAQTTNMMIGDDYTYVENRYDMNDPWERVIGTIAGQKGPKGEGYEEWIEKDDPEHQSYFTAAWDLAHSLVTKRSPGSVVWLWIQGYSFGDSIAETECKKGFSDLWATGKFPSKRYLRKEIASMIAAGGTGMIFFGFFNNRMPETEILLSFFRALSSADVYGPALTSPRLDLGFDTTTLGEPGKNGKGRVHVLAKWHDPSKTAYLIGSNPGGKATSISIQFPWSIEKAEILDWDVPEFTVEPAIEINNRTLEWTVPKDEGFIIRITPLFEQ